MISWDVLISTLAFATVACFIVAILTPKRGDARSRLRGYAVAGATRPERLARPFSQRVLLPGVQQVGRLIGGIMPRNLREETAVQLEMAGNPLSASTFLAIRTLLMVGLFVVYTPLTLGGQQKNLIQLGSFIVLFWLLSRLPKMWLNMRVSARQKQIVRKLPDALDLITVCMEAGLAFDAALAKVVEKTRGPLRDELARVLQEISLGKLRRDALRDLGRRTGVPDLVSFVAAIVQADQMGLGMAGVLRTQSDEMRIKRRQRAEETAMKAPVKILFPLILCIFPAMMIVTLGPAVMTIVTQIIGRFNELR